MVPLSRIYGTILSAGVVIGCSALVYLAFRPDFSGTLPSVLWRVLLFCAICAGASGGGFVCLAIAGGVFSEKTYSLGFVAACLSGLIAVNLFLAAGAVALVAVFLD